MARIGLCARERGCEHLKRFLGQEVIRKRILGSATTINVGGLPLGPPPVTVAHGLLVVGDAAGQVKPTSGGGIYPGLVAAKIAGGVAAAAAMEGDGSAQRLQEYDRIWRANLGRELEIGMRANRMLNRMSAKECDELVNYLAGRPGLIKTIDSFGLGWLEAGRTAALCFGLKYGEIGIRRPHHKGAKAQRKIFYSTLATHFRAERLYCDEGKILCSPENISYLSCFASCE